jgi:hypothetical protein
MNPINDGGPAYPPAFSVDGGREYGSWTVRDAFAAAALTGLLSVRKLGESTYAQFAEQSYAMADAMLEARSKEKV